MNEKIIGPNPDTRTIFIGENPADLKNTRFPYLLNMESAIKVPINIELSRYCIPLLGCS